MLPKEQQGSSSLSGNNSPVNATLPPRVAETRRLDWIPNGAAVAICLLGCAVLIGWQFDIQALKQVLPGFASMNPATAACFIAAGCSLWLAGSDAPYNRRLSLALAVIVFAQPLGSWLRK